MPVYSGKEEKLMKKKAYKAPRVITHLTVSFETIVSNRCPDAGFSKECPGD